MTLIIKYKFMYFLMFISQASGYHFENKGHKVISGNVRVEGINESLQ